MFMSVGLLYKQFSKQIAPADAAVAAIKQVHGKVYTAGRAAALCK